MRAKKSLGQNFLHNKRVIQDIVDAAELSPEDLVLEIGPGKGALTDPLLATGAHVIAVETDSDLIPVLSERFEAEIKEGRLRLVHEDIMKADRFAIGLHHGKYTIVANIPYYITGILIRTFLSTQPKPKKMVFVMQKEVAERIVERDGKGSVLSKSVAVYGKAKYVKKIAKRFFSPQPNVDSAALRIDLYDEPLFSNKEQEDYFFKILKAGFANKRKMLMNNLSSILSKEELESKFKALNIPIKARAEELSLETWITLSRALKN